MSEQLKPCPFCGGEASVERCEVPGDYMVVCLDCLVGAMHSEQEASPEVVSALWNKRTPDPDDPNAVITTQQALDNQDREIEALFAPKHICGVPMELVTAMWYCRPCDQHVEIGIDRSVTDDDSKPT